jgi:hypothetical protein
MEKYSYQVIVKNLENKIIVSHLFENMDNAIICFKEFHTRYSHYYKIIIKATQKQ